MFRLPNEGAFVKVGEALSKVPTYGLSATENGCAENEERKSAGTFFRC